jgi:hypothetical protein
MSSLGISYTYNKEVRRITEFFKTWKKSSVSYTKHNARYAEAPYANR